MNLERLIQMVLRIVIARGVGLVMNRAMGWMERRGRATASQDAKERNPVESSDNGGMTATEAPPKALDAKRLRQQMRMISRIGRMR